MDFFKDIWELAKNAGPFGTILMLYLWSRSDKERREAQAQLSVVSLAQTKAAIALEATLRAHTKTTGSMERTVGIMVSALKSKARPPKKGAP